MELEYKRNINKSFFCIKLEEKLADFEYEILTRNALLGFLPIGMTMENETVLYWYEITGKQALDSILDTELLNGSLMIAFLTDLCSVLDLAERYLLNPCQIQLSPEVIFKNNQTEQFYFCYSPTVQEDIGESFQKLMEYLLTKINHKEENTVKMAYQIYDAVIKEGYSLESVRENLKFCSKEEQITVIDKNPPLNMESFVQEEKRNMQENEVSKETFNVKKVFSKEQIKKVINAFLHHFFPDFEKLKNYKIKKVNQKEVQTIAFEPEFEEKKSEMPTVLLSEQKCRLHGLLKYEGIHAVMDMKLEEVPYIIGSSSKCHGCIENPTVSRHHAKITKEGTDYFIEDLNSANGTKVNGEVLIYKQKVSLKPDDIVEIADEKFRFF